MKVFISQSRERSRALAQELKTFVRKLVPATDPWVSTTGIEKGSRWPSELADNLERAAAGIICLASDNLNDRWILFEAGALSRQPSDKVWTFLLDVDHSQVEPPLSQFQHTKAEENDVWLMIESINNTASIANETSRRADDLSDLFEMLWPNLSHRIDEIRAMPAPKDGPPVRTTEDMLAEVLELLRRADSLSWMQEKTLKMLHQVYGAVLQEVPPSLAVLRGMQVTSPGGPRIRLGDLLKIDVKSRWPVVDSAADDDVKK